MRKQELIFQILKAQTEQSGFIFSEGVLEVLPGSIRLRARPTTTTCPAPTTSTSRRRRSASSIYRPAIRSQLDPAAEGRGAQFRHAHQGRGGQLRGAPDQARDKLFFENLTPLYPQERLRLETASENLAGRVMDLMTPPAKASAA